MAEGPTAVMCDFSLVIYPDSAMEVVWQTDDYNEYTYIHTDELCRAPAFTHSSTAFFETNTL